MSIVGESIPGARVLDLFAGSGALGLEALSRGAAHADFVETNRASLEALAGNIAALGVASEATIHRDDAERFAGRLDRVAYDLAFADPPYSAARPSRAFFRSSTAPTSCSRATILVATAIPPSPSATPPDAHRDLPGVVRPTYARSRRPDPAEPGTLRPAHRRDRDELVEAAALHRRRAGGAAPHRGGIERRHRRAELRRPAGGLRAQGGRDDGGARAPRRERLRVRVPDGAHESAAPQ